MQDSQFSSEDKDTEQLLQRYEDSLRGDSGAYFDADEIDTIVNHYLMNDNSLAAKRAVMLGVRLHPNNTLVQLAHVKVLFCEKKYDFALQIILKIERIEEDADVLIWKGNVLLRLNKEDAAMEAYQHAVNVETNQKELICDDIASFLMHEGFYEEALRFLQQACEINPNSTEVLADLSNLYCRMGLLEKAVDTENRILDIDPYLYVEWNKLGDLYMTLEQYDESIQAYEYAIAINEKFTVPYLGKADALYHKECYRKAAEAYEEVVDLLPKDESKSRILSMIANCYEQLDDFSTAEGYYRRSYVLNENNLEACEGVAISLMELNDYAEALKYLQRTLKSISYDSNLWIYVAECFVNLNQNFEAIAAYEKALNINQYQPDALLSMASLYVDEGDYTKALSHLQEAENMDMNLSGLASLLTVVYAKLDEPHIASYYLQKAMCQDENINEIMDIFANEIDWDLLKGEI